VTLSRSHRLFNPATPEAELACDFCSIGSAKTVFLGVGVGIGIGVELETPIPIPTPTPIFA
jgi:hypothetical protein